MVALGGQEPYFSKHTGDGQGTWSGRGGTGGQKSCFLRHSRMMMEGLQGGRGDTCHQESHLSRHGQVMVGL